MIFSPVNANVEMADFQIEDMLIAGEASAQGAAAYQLKMAGGCFKLEKRKYFIVISCKLPYNRR